MEIVDFTRFYGTVVEETANRRGSAGGGATTCPAEFGVCCWVPARWLIHYTDRMLKDESIGRKRYRS